MSARDVKIIVLAALAGVAIVVGSLVAASAAEARGWKPPRAHAPRGVNLVVPVRPWKRTPTAEVVAASLPIARSAWPGSGCEGREVIDFSPEATRTVRDLGFVGYAIAESCGVMVVAGLSPSRLCSVLVHEFGHLAGHGHTQDGGIMDADTPITWPQCAHLARYDFPPPLQMALAEVVAVDLDRPRAAWRGWCSRPRNGGRWCMVRTRGRRTAVRISVDRDGGFDWRYR